MCGIAGVYDSTDFVSPQDVRLMINAINHRGPDDAGITCFQVKSGKWWTGASRDDGKTPQEGNSDLVLGHVRLSIIDLSSAGHQPMSDSVGDVWITYNGEIYNYLELRKNLEECGYAFNSRTDTEVVLYAYKEYGESCLEHFKGFFAFCIYDAKKRQLFLARDRLGLKPLKYYWDGVRFAFASEVKALMQLPRISRTADPVALDQYLAYRYVPSPLTGIENIRKLPPGCSITLSLEKSNEGPRLNRYWMPQFGPKINVPFEEARGTMCTLLENSISMRLMSDVPLGVFLSGGLDSSSIVALLRKKYSGDIFTFSVGFSDEDYDERPYARAVAEQYGTIHTELLVDSRPEQDLQEIIWHFDEPFGDPSAIPSFYLAKATSSYVKVVLNGDGGDEVLAGYKRYGIHGKNRFLDFLPPHMHGVSMYLSEKVPFDMNKKSVWGRMRRTLESLSGDLTSTYPLRLAGLSMTTRRLLYRGCSFMKAANYGWPSEIVSLLSQTKADRAIERLLALDQLTYLPDDILVKSDLAGMSHGIEARSPFLDHVFLEWSNRLPLSYKMNKRLLREALSDELPYDIIKRKKAGFNPPLSKWMSTILKKGIEHYLLSENTPLHFMNRTLIEQMHNLNLSGKANTSEQLWLLLALAVWIERNQISLSF
jgi:asparagine synthase (glutamine-hydrolysing)